MKEKNKLDEKNSGHFDDSFNWFRRFWEKLNQHFSELDFPLVLFDFMKQNKTMTKLRPNVEAFLSVLNNFRALIVDLRFSLWPE
jgi:hypothetical protein